MTRVACLPKWDIDLKSSPSRSASSQIQTDIWVPPRALKGGSSSRSLAKFGKILDIQPVGFYLCYNKIWISLLSAFCEFRFSTETHSARLSFLKMALIPTSPRKRTWCVALIAAVVLAMIIAIIVPLAVTLPPKKKQNQSSTVLLPLYIYPETDSTWMPLYNA